MLTVSDEEEDLYESVKAGANGYLLKEIAIEEIAETVRAIVQRQGVISPSMTSKLIAEFRALSPGALRNARSSRRPALRTGRCRSCG